MPVPLTYPGVYIEEIPSGVRTITGVATSITAFLGRTLRGPADTPVVINSFADFERQFGGLWVDSPMTYAVRDFYRNGGAQAVIVRVFNDGGGTGTAELVLESDPAGSPFTLEAASPGSWGNKLRARVDYDTADPTDDTRFNLTIRDDATGTIEVFRNLSITTGHPRQVDKVLNNESALVRAPGPAAARPAEHDDPSATDPLWGDNTTNTKVPASAEAVDGDELTEDDYTLDTEADKRGLYALEKADLFNLLCLPPHGENDVEPTLIDTVAGYCQRRRAVLIVDPPRSWTDKSDAVDGVAGIGTSSNHAALYFPRLRAPNPLRDNQIEDFAPCGAVAGVIARTDAQRGVWKAPAGLAATIVGAPALSVPLTDAENGELNPLGVNCLRTMPAAGRVVWGARTLEGSDRLASEWKYLPVRRTALFIEESLYRGTQWVVFEPNDEPLWAQIRLNIGAFMNRMFRQGAFAGATPRDAYFVKCDKETTTQTDVNLGVVNIVVGFAPLKPAEFVVLKLQQMAGQITT